MPFLNMLTTTKEEQSLQCRGCAEHGKASCGTWSQPLDGV